MKGLAGGAALALLALAVFVGLGAVFTVSPTEQALVLRFGEAIKIVREPGLNFKLPLVDGVVRVDKRILALDLPEQEVIGAEQKRLLVDAFARYRVVNPLRFYQTLGSVERANEQLGTFVNAGLRRVLGESTFQQVVRDERAALMARIRDQVNAQAEGLGIDVIDVRIRRADLPQANSQAIYERMQTERQREAAEIRAVGAEAAQRIRAKADRDVVVTLAEANREAERIRGEGDGERTRIFAEAYSRNAEFFSFYRSMQAYEQGLRSTDTRLLLTPDSEFFRYFRTREQPAAESPAGTPTPAP